MTSVTVTTKSGAKVTAEYSIDGGKVTLSQDGHFAATGRVRYGMAEWARIEDCDARLGAADGSETDDTYAALEAAIAARLMESAETTETDAVRYFIVSAPGHYGDSTLVFSSHGSLAAARRAASGGALVVREGALAKGDRLYRSAEGIYPIAR